MNTAGNGPILKEEMKMNENPEKFAIEYLIKNGFKLEEDYNNFARQVVKIAIEALEKQMQQNKINV